MRLLLPIFILHALCLVNAANIPVNTKVAPGHRTPHDTSLSSRSSDLNPERSAHVNSVPRLPETGSKAPQKRQIHNADYSTKKPNTPQDNTNSTSTSSSSDSTEPQSSSGSGESRREPREPHHFLLSGEKARRRQSPRGSRGPFRQSAPVQSGKGRINGRSMSTLFSRILSRGLNPRLWFFSRDGAVPATVSPASTPISPASSSLRTSPESPSSDDVTHQSPSKRGDAKDCSSKPNAALPGVASKPTVKHERGASRGPSGLASGAEKWSDPNQIAKGDGSRHGAGHARRSAPSGRRWMYSEPQGTGQSKMRRARSTNGM